MLIIEPRARFFDDRRPFHVNRMDHAELEFLLLPLQLTLAFAQCHLQRSHLGHHSRLVGQLCLKRLDLSGHSLFRAVAGLRFGTLKMCSERLVQLALPRREHTLEFPSQRSLEIGLERASTVCACHTLCR